MVDMAETVAPKSDQLNADDLIAGPRTITITRVTGRQSKEQPVDIHFEGDDGRPYKPCKSMRRVLLFVWGRRSEDYIGRKLTLYRDPTVKYGGIEVGGIRISHMSHIDAPVSLALTAAKSSRKPYVVKPLRDSQPAAAEREAHRDQAPDVMKSPPSPDDAAASDGERLSGARSENTREADGSLPPESHQESTSPAAYSATALHNAGEDAGASRPSDAPAFNFSMTSTQGTTRETENGETWRDALIVLLTQKPYDVAKKVWELNRQHIKDAFANGQGDFAKPVQDAWDKRVRSFASAG